MSLKSWAIAAINLLCIALPCNIIGCGPYPNPFDNYISFVRNDLSADKSFKPFYYIRDAELYDPLAEASSSDNNCGDWVRYGKHSFSIDDAHQILCYTDTTELRTLYRSLEKGATSKIPSFLRKQPMIERLVHTRDTAALRYILFASHTEPYRISDDIPWSTQLPATKHQDSIACSRLAEEALIRSRHSSNPFIRARYAYLATSLAFYSHRYNDCIDIFRTEVHRESAGSLYAQALSFQAGAAYHSNRRSLAAYAYSRSFALGGPNISDYRGFQWSIGSRRSATLAKALTLCSNSRERADMMALYSLGSTLPEERSLREVYNVDPSSPILEVLTIREVHKIEQNDFSKRIKRQPGGLTMYEEYDVFRRETHNPSPWRAETQSLSAWLDSVSQDARVTHPGLYKTMAAYLFYMRQDYSRADTLLDQAARTPASPKLRTQQQLIRLLVTINTMDRLDKGNEEKLLPTIKWLETCAGRDKDSTSSDLDYSSQKPWQRIYRNLLAEIIARRYCRQGDSVREILSIGAAETVARNKHDQYGPYYTEDHIRQLFSANDCRALWNIIHASKKSAWDKYLIHHFPLSENELVKATTSALIREHRWQEALQWMNRLDRAAWFVIRRNPFIEAPNDRIDTTLPGDKVDCDKIQFVTTMSALERKEKAHRATAEDLYKMAVGFYNMSRYGRAQELVDYYAGSGWWSELPKGKTNFEKDYYGCYTAEEYALKAKAASKNNEFKARCQFLAAKCAQKRIRIDIDYDGYHPARWQKAVKVYDRQIRNNKYFPELVRDYGNTAFYREAFNTCSYLRDFVNKKN